MGLIIWYILLFLMANGCNYANARSLAILDKAAVPLDREEASKSEVSIAIATNVHVCTLCQEFTTQAVQYLSENETQFEIMNTLHKTCSHLQFLRKQCVLLVDYYVPLFFVEIATVQPAQFCEKVNLCEEMVSIRLTNRTSACTLCHQVMNEVLTKLEDPDAQLDIIETVLKVCSKAHQFAEKCKKLVFEYGPLILANAEKFLETTDVCAAIHMCKGGQEAASLGELFISSA